MGTGAGEVRFYIKAPVVPSGTGLPSCTTVGALFVLTQVSGSNIAGLYACITGATMTKVGP